jgi:hypothetical protein
LLAIHAARIEKLSFCALLGFIEDLDLNWRLGSAYRNAGLS